MLKKLVLTTLVVLLLAAGIGFKVLDDYMKQPLELPAGGIIVEVEPGSSLNSTIRSLHKKDILRNPKWVSLYIRLLHPDSVVKAGEFFVDTGVSPIGLYKILTSGKVLSYSVTLIEGWTVKQVVQHLSQQPNLINDIDVTNYHEALRSKGLTGPYQHPEGLFFPDTYSFTKGMKASDILRRAHEKLLSVLESEWSERQKDLPLASAYEGLILASIIEKETGQSHERPHISAVFINRLRKKMRLQTDPTVIYGVGDDFDGNLTRKHLRTKTPYNTYRINGLPPTPISIVGQASIHAAFHPSDDKSLYFVATGDGAHYFSTTIEQHNKAVRKYQKFQRAKNYRSAPK